MSITARKVIVVVLSRVALIALLYVCFFQLAAAAIGFDSGDPITIRGVLEWNEFLFRFGLERATAIQFLASLATLLALVVVEVARFIRRPRVDRTGTPQART